MNDAVPIVIGCASFALGGLTMFAAFSGRVSRVETRVEERTTQTKESLDRVTVSIEALGSRIDTLVNAVVGALSNNNKPPRIGRESNFDAR